MKVDLWFKSFSEGAIPEFPCPHCQRGHLRLRAKNDLIFRCPKYSDDEIKYEQREIDAEIRRFAGVLTCTRASCGEVVTFSGDLEWDEGETEEGHGLVSKIVPRMMSPAPHIIEIPTDTPAAVRRHVEQSFGLYWADHNACANSLRSAGEALMNSLHVPRAHRVKAKPAQNGKPAKPAHTVDLDFNGRVQKLSKRNQSQAKVVDAIRKLGNLGSHGSAVSLDQIQNAYRLTEFFLREVFERKVLLALAKEVVASTPSGSAKKSKNKVKRRKTTKTI